MPSLSGATELYILERDRLPVVLIPDSDGIPTYVEPQPILLRAVYLSLDELEIGIPSARTQLNADSRLFAPIQCPDGPPYRLGLYFDFQRMVSGMPWRDERTERHGARMRQYGATTAQGPWIWLADARSGRPGYFLTGDGGNTSLWRIFRLEVDALNRSVFTITPVRLAANCPALDFSSLHEPLLADELTAQYEELCTSVIQHAYRDVVTKARNIVEGLVSARLKIYGQPSVGRLNEDLKTVRALLEGPMRDVCGWSDMEYHLAHKVRLLHGRTHPEQVVVSGQTLRPEFALTVVEDLVELLRAWGFCAP